MFRLYFVEFSNVRIVNIASSFKALTQYFMKVLQITSDHATVVKQCRIYCKEHWNDEQFDLLLKNSASMEDLFHNLESSALYNFLNPGLLKHLAIMFEVKNLITTVKNYQENFNSIKLQDITFIRRTEVTGVNIPEKDRGIVASAMLQQGITIGQLQEMCTPTYLDLFRIIILDFGQNIPDFYHFIKVVAVLSNVYIYTVPFKGNVVFAHCEYFI